MPLNKLIPFDRALAGVVAPGHNGRQFSELELTARAEAAYRRGVDDARALADHQIVELRGEIDQLASGLFRNLEAVEPALLSALREALPGLAVDIARRLLAGYEPPADVVARICEEALAEIFPERENLVLVVGPRDAELIEKLQPEWQKRFPGLRISVEPALKPGDCQVRSRFGLTDARFETKLGALQHSLAAT